MSSFWTSPADFSVVCSCVGRFFRECIFPMLRLCLFSGLIFATSACNVIDLVSPLPKSSSSSSASATPAPPGSGDRPPDVGQLGRPMGADGLPTLRAPKGVNVSVDTLFAEDIQDPITRIKRVENAVLEMRRDFDQTLPAIKRLVAVEKDMQTLMAQLESLLGGDAASIAPPSASAIQNSPVSTDLEGSVAQVDSSLPPAGIPTPEVTTENPAAPQDSRQVNTVSSAAAVSMPVKTHAVSALDMRLGESAGKTRLVIDLDGSVTYKADLDNQEKILLIEVTGAQYKGAASRTFAAPLVKSMSTQPLEDGSGFRMIVALNGESAVLSSMLLQPGSGNPNHRLVIDLKK